MPGLFGYGLAILLFSGVLNGAFPVPMKFSRAWKWENNWLAFTTLALFVFPLLLALALVPNLGGVYGSVSAADFAPGLAFGFLWGLAQVTFGIAFTLVGMAMAFAIVVGMSGVLGSFIPMIVLHPEDLLGPRGLSLMVTAVILVAGLIVYARAARERERQSSPGGAGGGGNYRKGMAVCIFTGALGGMINLGFAFSGRLTEQAIAMGSTPRTATFAVWFVVLAGGYIPNLAYTVYLLAKNRTAGCFAKSPMRETLLATAMAVLWLGGTQGYGIGAATMGAYGTSIGYAIYVIMLILTSTILGVMTGEWKSASRATYRKMQLGLGIILLSVIVLSGWGMFL